MNDEEKKHFDSWFLSIKIQLNQMEIDIHRLKKFFRINEVQIVVDKSA